MIALCRRYLQNDTVDRRRDDLVTARDTGLVLRGQRLLRVLGSLAGRSELRLRRKPLVV